MCNEKHRLELVYGKNNIDELGSKKVVIAGLGGVGSYAAEAIARSFINNIVLIDYDVYDITNLNRQLYSNLDTVGKYKIDVISDNIKKINKEVSIIEYKTKLTKDNIDSIIQDDVDFVIDAIDDVKAKIELIQYCYNNDINIISCMGTGNKFNPELLKITDIYKTTMCPLAKKIRTELRKRNIKKLPVIFSTEEIIKNNTTMIGSTPFVPSVAGLMMASYVVNIILKK